MLCRCLLQVCVVRTSIFAFRPQLENLQPSLIKLTLLDLPGLIFFTTYTLLVLFWAEIYHQARSMPTGSLRPVFVGLNILVYGVQAGLWVLSSWAGDAKLQQIGYIASDVFLALVSVSAAAGFLLYGGRLFLMLQRWVAHWLGWAGVAQHHGECVAHTTACHSAQSTRMGGCLHLSQPASPSLLLHSHFATSIVHGWGR